jgi:hypothetical protein
VIGVSGLVIDDAQTVKVLLVRHRREAYR